MVITNHPLNKIPWLKYPIRVRVKPVSFLTPLYFSLLSTFLSDRSYFHFQAVLSRKKSSNYTKNKLFYFHQLMFNISLAYPGVYWKRIFIKRYILLILWYWEKLCTEKLGKMNLNPWYHFSLFIIQQNPGTGQLHTLQYICTMAFIMF